MPYPIQDPVRPGLSEDYVQGAVSQASTDVVAQSASDSDRLQVMKTALQIVLSLAEHARAQSQPLDISQMETLSAVLSAHLGDKGNTESAPVMRLKQSLDSLAIASHHTQAQSEEARTLITQQQNCYKETAAYLAAINTSSRDSQLHAKARASSLSATINQAKTKQRAGDTEDAFAPGNARSADQNAAPPASYTDMWDNLAAGIGSIKDDYADFYADLMLQYTKMYEDFNNMIQKAAAEAVKEGADANKIKFDFKKLNDGYKEFWDKYDPQKKPIGNVKNWAQMTQDQKDKMVATLKPAFTVSSDGKISFDLTQFDKLQNNTFSHDKKGTDDDVSTTTYQAWLATFNAMSSALQSNMQSFATRYTQASTTYDNLNKVFSGSISTLAEAAREVFKALS